MADKKLTDPSVPVASNTTGAVLYGAQGGATKQFPASLLSGGGTGGPLTGMPVAANRTALAGIDPAVTPVVFLKETGREGIFRYNNQNLTTQVAADTAQGVYVAPTSQTSGAGGAWVRQYEGGLNPKWFGAVADGLTDCLAAFNATHDLAKALIRPGFRGGGGAKISIPAGLYYLSDTWNIHTRVMIEGEGMGEGYVGTMLRFPKNKTGVVFNNANTHGEGLGTQGHAAGSKMSDISLMGGGVGVDANGSINGVADPTCVSGHGVRIRTTYIILENVFVYCFGGDGFNIHSTSGSGDPVTEGNANNFHLSNCYVAYCRRHGLAIIGNDSNAGQTDVFTAYNCNGCGIFDVSFLGNLHNQPHVANCGGVDAFGGDAPTGGCFYNGQYWYVRWGKEAQASTEVPGSVTNGSEAWRPCGGFPGWRPWASGKTWIIGRPYANNPENAGNGRGCLVNPYAESGQAPSIGSTGWFWLGGVMDEAGIDPDNRATVMTSRDGGFMEVPGFSTTIGGFAAGLRNRPDTIFQMAGNSGDYVSAKNKTIFGKNFIQFRGGELDGRAFLGFNLTDDSTWVGNLLIGSFEGGFYDPYRVSFGAAAPGSGTWYAGAIVFNKAPSPGSPIGWRCRGTGDPGTWDAFYGMAAAPQPAIANASAAAAAPTKAEFDALVDKFNSLLAAARAQNIILA